MDITVEKFKIFKILSFYGAMYLKWKLRMCTIQIELEKIGFISKNFFSNFSDFHLRLEDPQKFSMSIFSIFWKTNTKTGFLGPGKYGKEQSQEVWLT